MDWHFQRKASTSPPVQWGHCFDLPSAEGPIPGVAVGLWGRAPHRDSASPSEQGPPFHLAPSPRAGHRSAHPLGRVGRGEEVKRPTFWIFLTWHRTRRGQEPSQGFSWLDLDHWTPEWAVTRGWTPGIRRHSLGPGDGGPGLQSPCLGVSPSSPGVAWVLHWPECAVWP